MKQKQNLEFILSLVFSIALVPLLIWIGIHFFADRKYYLISIGVMVAALIPLMVRFKQKALSGRRIVLISSMTALAVLGRIAFFFAPQFKPVTAMVIISGVVLGPCESFFVGAATALISNFYFGQGPWTVWQMYAFGLIGWIAGIILKNKSSTVLVCIYGFISCFVIYGGIMNFASVVMLYSYVTLPTIKAAYYQGIPFDLIHAVATVVFLYFLYPLFREKVSRIKKKYNL